MLLQLISGLGVQPRDQFTNRICPSAVPNRMHPRAAPNHMQAAQIYESCHHADALQRPSSTWVVTLLLETLGGAQRWEVPRNQLLEISKLGEGSSATLSFAELGPEWT